MKIEPMPSVEIDDSVYRDYSSQEFPLCELLETHGPVFKFKAPGHELHDAKNVDRLISELASMAHVNTGGTVRSFQYQKLKLDDAYVYRASNIRVIKTINVKSYLTTARKLSAHELDPSNIDDIDKLFQGISRKSISYIHNIVRNSDYHLDGNVFHNPAAIRNPIVLLKETNHPPGISQDWLYVGKRHTNSFFHTDDFGLPVINTMLNDGRKLWMVIDPGDNHKIIQKLRSISGLDNSCPYNYLDTKALIPPSTLRQWGIQFYTTIQRQHESIVLGENVFHQCINLDLSINRAINFLCFSRFIENSTVYCQCPSDGKHRHDDGVEINGCQLLAAWRTRNNNKVDNKF